VEVSLSDKRSSLLLVTAVKKFCGTGGWSKNLSHEKFIKKVLKIRLETLFKKVKGTKNKPIFI
jgi:hypothetical protein